MDNPFIHPREPKTKMIHFRLTPTEFDALKAVLPGKKARNEISELIRQGIGLAIDLRAKKKP